MLWLNYLFALKCLEACEAIERQDFRSPLVSMKWAGINIRYQQTPDDLVVLVPSMAAVHILDDLESVLFFVDVEDEEFDSINDEITHCLRTTDFSAGLGEQQFNDLLNNRLTRALWTPGIWVTRWVVLKSARELRTNIGFEEPPPDLSLGQWETKAVAERIWEESGFEPGKEKDNWFKAEAELAQAKRQRWMQWYERERRRLALYRSQR